MDQNFLIFPSPAFNWTESDLKNKIIYIPFYDRNLEKDLEILQNNHAENFDKDILADNNEDPSLNMSCIIKKNDLAKSNIMQKSQSKYLSNEMEPGNSNLEMANDHNGVNFHKSSLECNLNEESNKEDFSTNMKQDINAHIENNKKFEEQTESIKMDKENSSQNVTDKLLYHIPCLYLPARDHRAKFVLFFHGNGEDINNSLELCSHICDQLYCHVIAMEYPGYSCFQGTPSEDTILKNAMTVYKYMINQLNINPQDIIIIGRSIGSGPAVWLASKRDVGAQILISAFTSIKDTVYWYAGYLASLIVKDRFDNKSRIKNVKCPIFFLHGMKDDMVPFTHSEIQYDSVSVPSELYLPKDMTHSSFMFEVQFTNPVLNFLHKIQYSLDTDKTFWMKVKLFKKVE